MQRWKKIFVGLLAVISLAVTAIIATNPLRHSDQDVEKWILKKTPIGCSVQEVDGFIARQGLERNMDFQGNTSVERSLTTPVRGFHIVGARGHYQGLPWRIQVQAYWGFTADDKLIDVNVRKWGEGI